MDKTARERLQELKDTVRYVDGSRPDYWTLQSRILDAIYHDQIYKPFLQPKESQ